jgi:hypothetical protein
MAKLDLIFFDAGGGHRAAATALKQICGEKYPHWEVRMVNLQETLDSLDIFRQVTGIRMEDVYNHVLRKGWTLGSAQLLVAMHGLIRLYHPLQVKKLKQFWSAGAPDLAISLIPNFNRALFESLRAVTPRTKLVTVLTDIADYPPHFWIEPKNDQWFICGSAKAESQALEIGHKRDRVFRTSGMILNPRFHQPLEVDRNQERARLGLKPGLPVGLVMFGGFGSNVMAKIGKLLSDSGSKVQLIFICGKNVKLRERLQTMELKMPHYIEGFTSQIPYYMKLSDFFVGKPGPGSISEAVQMGLPVIVTRNILTLPQERYNADWVLENGVGLVKGSFSEIVPAVEELLQPGVLDRFQANARRLDNRAVFEIPEILEKLLKA